MRSFLNALTLLLLFGLLTLAPVSRSAIAQDEVQTDELEGSAEEEIELTDEKLDELLTRVDRFYYDQGMARLTVDVDIYRDPSNQLNENNIREGDPSRIAGLSTIISHYAYRHPGFYELKIMGQVLAGSEVPPDQTFFSQLLPMPGAPIYTENLRERFRIRFERVVEIDNRPVYKIRYTARDRDAEFFNYIVYYIDIEHEVLLKVDSSFDNEWYAGTGAGDFYYDSWRGKYLPVYGHGRVLMYPNRRYNVWGRWYRWNWQSPEELEASSEAEESLVDETEAGE